MSRLLVLIFAATAFFPVAVQAQQPDRRVSIAIVDVGDSSVGRLATTTLTTNLQELEELNIVDRDLARSAARGAGYTGSLNLSLEEAQRLGAALGTDFYIIGDAQTLRRSPSTAEPYFDSYASIFLVSARSGKLVLWLRPHTKAASVPIAEKQLWEDLSGSAIRQRLVRAIMQTLETERNGRALALERGIPLVEDAPDDETSAAAQGLKLPRPYRRLRPPYPETAASAEVEATVDVLVSLDERGEVGEVEIARWAGFGLDEATIETVRKLHFFPAMRNGTAIPLRVLLRYNFRKPSP